MRSSFLDEEEDPTERRRNRRGAGFWHQANRLLSLGIIIAALAVVAVVFYPVRQKQLAMQKRVAALTAEKAEKSTRLQESRRKLELLKNDPEYVETIARDRLNVMKPGETIFRIELPHALGTSVQP